MFEASDQTTTLANSSFQCPVCMRTFRNPKVLKCGHSFCEDPCLTRVVRPFNKINCPECRTETTLPPGGVKELLSNFTLIRAIRDEQEKRRCVTHGQDLTMKCYSCEVRICPRCLNDGHKIMEHDTEASRLLEYVLPAKDSLSTYHLQAKQRLDELLKEQRIMTEGMDKIKLEIKSAADRAREEIARKETLLLQNLHRILTEDEETFSSETQRYERIILQAREQESTARRLEITARKGELQDVQREKDGLMNAVEMLYKELQDDTDSHPQLPKLVALFTKCPPVSEKWIGELKFAAMPAAARHREMQDPGSCNPNNSSQQDQIETSYR